MDLTFTVGKFVNFRKPEEHIDGELIFIALVHDVTNGGNKRMRGVDAFNIEHLAENIVNRLEEDNISEWQVRNSPSRENPDAVQSLSKEEYSQLSRLLGTVSSI